MNYKESYGNSLPRIILTVVGFLPRPIYVFNSVVNTKLLATYINLYKSITSVAAKFKVTSLRLW